MNRYQATIDVSKNIEHYFDVPLFTGDSGNTVELSFFCGGEPYPMDNVMITARRADGAVVFDAGSMEDNTAVFTMKNNIHSQPGQLEVQVALTDNSGAVLTSGVLHFDVLDGYKENSGVEADDRLPVLTQAVENAMAQADYAREMGDYARDWATEISDDLGYYANLAYYRVEIDPDNPNPETAVSYADVPHGTVPGIAYWKDQFPFSDIEVWTVKDGVENDQLDPDDYTKKLKGLRMLEGLDPDSPTVQNAFEPAEKVVYSLYDAWKADPQAVTSNVDIIDPGWVKGKVSTSVATTEGVEIIGAKYFVLTPTSAAPSISLTAGSIPLPKTGLYQIAINNPMMDGYGTDGNYIRHTTNGVIQISDKNGLVMSCTFDFSQNCGWCDLGTFELDASEPITVTFTNNEYNNMRVDAISFTDAVNADITSGEEGDVMVKIPKMYYKFETLANGRQSFTVCNKKGDSSFISTAFDTSDNGTQDYFWAGAYEGTVIDGKLRSLSGKTPSNTYSLSSNRTYANALGQGYGIGNVHQAAVLNMLFILMFKSLDKNALGKSYVSKSSPAQTGLCNQSGLYYGSTASTPVKFCGIENWYGSLAEYQDGWYINSSGRLLCAAYDYNDTGSGYIDAGPKPGSGFISKMSFQNLTPFLPTGYTGSESTYYCAGINTLQNNAVAATGGGYWESANSGPFRTYFYETATSAAYHFGARLTLTGGAV